MRESYFTGGVKVTNTANFDAFALMEDLAQLGIRLEAHDDRLRFSPRSAVTPDLARRLKACKDQLLAVLRTEASACPVCGSAIGWRSDLRVICANCYPKPEGAEKVVVVHQPGRREWAAYDAEFTAQQTRRAAQNER